MNPNPVRINKSLGDRTGLTGLGVQIIEVAPGHDTTEHHTHYHEDECVFVLERHRTVVSRINALIIPPNPFNTHYLVK